MRDYQELGTRQPHQQTDCQQGGATARWTGRGGLSGLQTAGKVWKKTLPVWTKDYHILVFSAKQGIDFLTFLIFLMINLTARHFLVMKPHFIQAFSILQHIIQK
jgi:hypothetical protein